MSYLSTVSPNSSTSSCILFWSWCRWYCCRWAVWSDRIEASFWLGIDLK
jgi:hypothetical protein